MDKLTFYYLAFLFEGQHRFNTAGVVKLNECHELCSSKFATLVDGTLWQEVNEFLNDKLNNIEVTPNSNGQSSSFHVNVMFDFEQNKWLNVGNRSEFNTSLWFNHIDLEPVFPIMDNLIILYGTCIDYFTVNQYTVDVFGTVICNGDNERNRFPQQLKTFHEATHICGEKGLWFPMDIHTFKMKMDMFQQSSTGQFQLMWTGARRYNESHFIFNGTIFDATYLESCIMWSKTGTFRSNVIMTRQWLSDGATDRPYAVSSFLLNFILYVFFVLQINVIDDDALCVCSTRGLFKDEIPKLLLEVAIILIVFVAVIVTIICLWKKLKHVL